MKEILTLSSIIIIVVSILVLTACVGMVIIKELVPALVGIGELTAFIILVIVIYKVSTRVPCLLGMIGLIIFIILVIVLYEVSTNDDNKKE